MPNCVLQEDNREKTNAWNRKSKNSVSLFHPAPITNRSVLMCSHHLTFAVRATGAWHCLEEGECTQGRSIWQKHEGERNPMATQLQQ